MYVEEVGALEVVGSKLLGKRSCQPLLVVYAVHIKTDLSKVDFIKNNLIWMSDSIEASNESKDCDDNDG